MLERIWNVLETYSERTRNASGKELSSGGGVRRCGLGRCCASARTTALATHLALPRLTVARLTHQTRLTTTRLTLVGEKEASPCPIELFFRRRLYMECCVKCNDYLC